MNWLESLKGIFADYSSITLVLGTILVILAILSRVSFRGSSVELLGFQRIAILALGVVLIFLSIKPKGPSILTGHELYPSGATGWSLNQSSGGISEPSYTNLRRFKTYIKFKSRFTSSPKVEASIYYLDANVGPRVSVEVTDPDQDGFWIAIKTWDASIVYGAGVSWIAHSTD